MRKPDELRPFGYGKELYFWSFVVSLCMFSLGGCISVYEGIVQFGAKAAGVNIKWSCIVLLTALLFTGISLSSALKAFNSQRKAADFWPAILNSKDPSVFIVLLGDIADIAGLIVAFAGVLIAHLSGNIWYDALASTIIGCIMLAISALLLRESKSLLMGETIRKQTLKNIVSIAETDQAIVKVRQHFSTYMGPDEVILQLNAVFRDSLTTTEITDAISRIIKKIQAQFPSIRQIFIEPVPG